MRHEIVERNPEADVRFFYSSDTGGYVTPHWHNSLEMIYMLSGYMTIEFPQERVSIGPDEFAVINSGAVHAVLSEANEALVLQVPFELLRRTIDHYELITFRVDMHPKTDAERARLERMRGLFRHMYAVYSARETGYLLRFHSLLYALLYELTEGCATREEPSAYVRNAPYLSRLRQIMQYLDAHHAEKLRVSALAAEMGYNADYLSRFFKKHMGVGLIEYLYRLRLNYVYHELCVTDDPIQEIFDRHGCANEKHVEKLFRERYGATPREIRRRSKM